MVMDWFTVVILWLIAPIVEAVVIIALLTRNGRGKEEKASQAGYGMGAYKPLPSGQMGGWEYGNPANLDESRLRTISIKPALAKERDKGTKKAKLAADLRDNLGTVSLITGVVLVILSGAVFATTKWQVLSDASKVFLVFGAALLFFAISCMAEKVFHIRRTGNAFYILGSVFLFLSVMAAAYFGFFGPSFALEGEGRWKVCWLGSLAMEAALLLGLRRFCDRVYTQASLWGMTVSICFMAKAFGAGINGLMGSMAWLGAGLVLAYRYMEQYTERCESFREKEGLGSRVKEALSGFLPVHFLIVCGAGGLSWLDMLGVQGQPACGLPHCRLWRGLDGKRQASRKRRRIYPFCGSFAVSAAFWPGYCSLKGTGNGFLGICCCFPCTACALHPLRACKRGRVFYPPVSWQRPCGNSRLSGGPK